jgi:hypothetical protein
MVWRRKDSYWIVPYPMKSGRPNGLRAIPFFGLTLTDGKPMGLLISSNNEYFKKRYHCWRKELF